MSVQSEQIPTAEEDQVVPNEGNPVFTPHQSLIQTAPAMITPPSDSVEELAGPQHPMYTTSSSSYGQFKPSVESVPTSFHGRSQKFSRHLSQSGMYRNHSLNTARDHTRV